MQIIFISTDKNECVLSTHDCHMNATCENTDGSYKCHCAKGFSATETSCIGKY